MRKSGSGGNAGKLVVPFVASGGLKWLLQSASQTRTVLCTTMLAAGVVSILRAAQRPLWYDEIYTVVLSKVEPASSIWSALQDAVDTNPPVYYLVTRLFSQLPVPAEASYRLPSILGFVGFCICLYFLTRSVAGPGAGLIAAVLPLATPIYDPHAAEARPYALLCASLAVALLCWRRSDRRVFALLFACALAIAMSLHYYAVFAIGAFIAGEAILSFYQRSLRPHVWLAFLAGLVPLLIFWPLIQAIRTYYAAGFWARPQLDLIPQSYDNLLSLHSNLGVAVALVLLVPLILDDFHVLGAASPKYALNSAVDPGFAGILALLLLSPALITIAAKLLGAGMSDRYAMAPFLTAAPICAGLLAVRLGSRVAGLVTAVLLIALGVSTLSTLTTSGRGNDLAANLGDYQLPQSWLQLSRDEDLPIVVSDGVFYLTAYYYGSPEQRDRLMTVVDPPSALNYVNTDSVDRNLIALRKYLPIRADDFQTFATAFPRFLLLSPHDINGDYFDWWQRRLAADGYALRVEAIVNRQVLYWVER